MNMFLLGNGRFIRTHLDVLCTRDRNDVVTLRKDPRQSDLASRHAVFGSNLFKLVYGVENLWKVFSEPVGIASMSWDDRSIVANIKGCGDGGGEDWLRTWEHSCGNRCLQNHQSISAQIKHPINVSIPPQTNMPAHKLSSQHPSSKRTICYNLDSELSGCLE